MKRIIIRLVVLLAGLVAVTVVSLALATGFVVEDDPLRESDVIYVLNGRISVRSAHAARVFHAGFAPRVLVAHTREAAPARRNRPGRTASELMAAAIIARGVPASAVEIIPFPGGAVNTRDEAVALRRHLGLHPARRLIVVTADYHSGRARRMLGQELAGLRVELVMAAAGDPDGITPANWWRSPEGRRLYGTEVAQQIGAILRYPTTR